MPAANFHMKLDRRGKNFRAMAHDTDGFVEEAQRENATDLQATAFRRAPKRTGFMATHIVIKKIGPLRYDIVATADYSAFVEHGTSRMPAQPFLQPALVEVKPRAEKRLADALRKGTAE
jgi:HK97 gp10 family phage protein